MSESQDLREFIREQTLRLERRKTDDLLAENRAQREALFRIFDRLDGGGAASAG